MGMSFKEKCHISKSDKRFYLLILHDIIRFAVIGVLLFYIYQVYELETEIYSDASFNHMLVKDGSGWVLIPKYNYSAPDHSFCYNKTLYVTIC